MFLLVEGAGAGLGLSSKQAFSTLSLIESQLTDFVPNVALLMALTVELAIEPTRRGRQALLTVLLTRSRVNSQRHRETTSATTRAMCSFIWLTTSLRTAGVTVAEATWAIVGFCFFFASLIRCLQALDQAAWLPRQLAQQYSSFVLVQSAYRCGPAQRTHFCGFLHSDETWSPSCWQLKH